MSISDTQKLTTLHPEVNGQPDNNTNIYPNVPRYLTLCYNLVVNGNGVQFSSGGSYSYKFVEVPKEISPYPQYDISLFAFGGGTTIQTTTPVTDLSIIKEYLSFMNGSDYVPVYNATKPNECFLWKTQDDSCWKLQYAENVPNVGNVLLAFKVDEDKLPLMKTIKRLSGLKTENVDYFNKTSSGDYTVFHFDTSIGSAPIFDANNGSNVFGFVATLSIQWTGSDRTYRLNGGSTLNYVFGGQCNSGAFDLWLTDDVNYSGTGRRDAFITAVINPMGDGIEMSTIDIKVNTEGLIDFDSNNCSAVLTITKLFDFNVGG